MNDRIALTIALLLASATTVSSATPVEITTADQEAVEQCIHAQLGSSRSADGQPVAEYQAARRIVAGSGPRALLALQYTIETGNSWQIYIALFDRSTHRLLASGRVGGKAYREVSITSIAEGGVELEASYYAPQDGLCCPSIRGTSFIGMREGHLWETNMRISSPR